MKYWFLCTLLGLAGTASAIAWPINTISTGTAPDYLTLPDLQDPVTIPTVVTLDPPPDSFCEGACFGMSVSVPLFADGLTGGCPPEVCGVTPPPLGFPGGIPEPAAASLVALGLLALLALRIRKATT